jgi:hypothetical protein
MNAICRLLCSACATGRPALLRADVANTPRRRHQERATGLSLRAVPKRVLGRLGRPSTRGSTIGGLQCIQPEAAGRLDGVSRNTGCGSKGRTGGDPRAQTLRAACVDGQVRNRSARYSWATRSPKPGAERHTARWDDRVRCGAAPCRMEIPCGHGIPCRVS